MTMNMEILHTTEYTHSSIEHFKIMQGLLQLMAYFILKMDDLLRKIGTEVLAFSGEIREKISNGLIINNQEIISRVVEMIYLIFELKKGYLAPRVSEGNHGLVSNQNNYEKFSMADNLIQDHSTFSILLINDQENSEDLQKVQYRRIKEQPSSLADHCKESEPVYPRLECMTQAVPVKNEKDLVLDTCDQEFHWDPYYREEVDSNSTIHESWKDVTIIGEGGRAITSETTTTNTLTAYFNLEKHLIFSNAIKVSDSNSHIQNHHETTERKRHSNTEHSIYPDAVQRDPGYVLRIASYYESLNPGKHSHEYLFGKKYNTPTRRYCLREFKLIDTSQKLNSTRCF